jgi:hypothetical protein
MWRASDPEPLRAWEWDNGTPAMAPVSPRWQRQANGRAAPYPNYSAANLCYSRRFRKGKTTPARASDSQMTVSARFLAAHLA